MARPRNINSPNEFWELFHEYVLDLEKKSEQWVKFQYVGKDGERVTDNLKVPMTIEGFKRYCWDVEVGCIEQYLKNQDNLYEEFIPICTRIKNSIRENQIIGGMLNVYNPSITQRLNGLAEKTETEIKGSLNIPNLPDIGNRK